MSLICICFAVRVNSEPLYLATCVCAIKRETHRLCPCRLVYCVYCYWLPFIHIISRLFPLFKLRHSLDQFNSICLTLRWMPPPLHCRISKTGRPSVSQSSRIPNQDRRPCRLCMKMYFGFICIQMWVINRSGKRFSVFSPLGHATLLRLSLDFYIHNCLCRQHRKVPETESYTNSSVCPCTQ